MALCSAQLTVVQSAPATITTGADLRVDITITNTGTSSEEVLVEQGVGYEPIEPKPHFVDIPGYVTPKHYYWEATIGPGETKVFYFIERLTGGRGHYYIPAATAYVLDGGEYKSNTLSIKITCNANGVCEIYDAEDYRLCPEDCPSGGTDFYCDEMPDGICDPDCIGKVESVDPDCTGNETAPHAPTSSVPVQMAPKPPEDPGFPWFLAIGAVLVVLVAIGAYAFAMKKR